MDGKNRRRFIALDSWRGLCALMVAAHNVECSVSDFVMNSSLFVDFFFVLSGFVITHSYMRRLVTYPDMGAFMLRRFGRLWPLHFALLTAFVGLELLKLIVAHRAPMTIPPFGGSDSVESILPNALLVQSLVIHGRPSWNIPSWSISTEFWTYLGFGAICLCWSKSRPPVIFMLGIALSAASGVILFSPSFLETNSNYSLLRCVYGFALGHLTYRLWESSSSKLFRPSSLEILASAIVVIFVFADGGILSMAAPPIFGFAVFIFAHEGGHVSRILSARIFTQLGAWSYSIYMVHWLVLSFLSRTINILGQPNTLGSFEKFKALVCGATWISNSIFIAFLLTAVSLAALTYHFIERPSREFFNRLADKLDRPDAESSRTPIDEPTV